jgi:hypothetical protein
MKMKINKRMIAAVFFIFLMAGSTAVYSLLQAFRPQSQTIELPTSNIINYDLTVEQKSYLLGKGKTIIEARYYTGCVECQLSYLGSLANQYSDQVILEELLSDKYEITIISYFGQKDLTNATQDKIFSSLCELMVSPPPICVRV